jgi:hypothetical protein
VALSFHCTAPEGAFDLEGLALSLKR